MKLSVLILCDDAWHPAAVVQRGFEGLASLHFAFEFIKDGSQWSSELTNKFSVIVVAKANHLCATNQNPWLTTQTQSAFREFVHNGGGLFLIHAGTCYKDLPEMCGLAGGAFMSHPDQCPVTVIPKVGHPVTIGVNAFTEYDEHYFMAINDSKSDVFMHSSSSHGVQPAGWTRTEGNGRVCVLTPGHNVEVWLHPEFQKLLGNGLAWVAKLN